MTNCAGGGLHQPMSQRENDMATKITQLAAENARLKDQLGKIESAVVRLFRSGDRDAATALWELLKMVEQPDQGEGE